MKQVYWLSEGDDWKSSTQREQKEKALDATVEVAGGVWNWTWKMSSVGTVMSCNYEANIEGEKPRLWDILPSIL